MLPLAPPRCSHRPPCPGCPAFGEALGAQLGPLSALASDAGVALERPEPPARFGYRVRARLAVRGRAASPKLGIFEEGSHRVVDIPRCPVHHPRINEVVAELRACVRELQLPPYAEASHRGLLRYVQIVIERGSGSAQVVLVVNAADAGAALPLCARLRERLGARLHGLFVSPNAARGNRILGARCELVHGSESIEERIAGARVFFPPDAFGQSNLDGYEVIVEHIGTLVPDGAALAELYAGTGAIGLSLAPRVRSLLLNELGDGSLRGLRAGIAALPVALRARVDVQPGDAEAQLRRLGSADVVIVDPPRKGLSPEACAELRGSRARRVVYLSCDVDSFVRDARRLLDDGTRKITSLRAYDLFPNTGHVETLACFDRA